MKIEATLKLKNGGQVTQNWELLDGDDEINFIAVVSEFENGDIIGIPIHKNLVEPIGNTGFAKFKYPSMLDISNAEHIPRVGN
jgi:hypothetical protein